jgi:hypothetical protein
MEEKKDTITIQNWQILLFSYLFISLVPFLHGLMNAGPKGYSPCDSEMSRIEYVFPSYRLGCFLGSPPNKD